MSFLGLRGTGDWATDERPKNFRETILWRNPNGNAPLTALLAKARSESVDDPEFNWWEEQQDAFTCLLNGAIGTGVATTFTLDGNGTNEHGNRLVAGDLLQVEDATGEVVEVNTITSDLVIEVVRSQAGTTGAAIADNIRLTKIGSVFAEGEGSPNVSSRNPTKVFNYTQIFKTAFELTRTAKKTRTRTGDPMKNDKIRKMFDHSASLEMAFLYGRRHETTGSNGKPKRYTGGLKSFITTNKTTSGWTATTPTPDEFINAIAPVFDYTSNGAGNQRLILAGNGALTALNRSIRNAAYTSMEMGPKITKWGMDLREYTVPQGSFYLRTHPLLNVHPTHTNTMIVIDPSNLVYRYIDDTKIDKGPGGRGIQDNDADSEKNQWLTEAGLEVEHEGTMAWFENFGA